MDSRTVESGNELNNELMITWSRTYCDVLMNCMREGGVSTDGMVLGLGNWMASDDICSGGWRADGGRFVEAAQTHINQAVGHISGTQERDYG